MIREFPGDLVVRTVLSLPCPGFSPWWGNCDPESHSSVKFSCSVVSTSLRLHGLQHTRIPCPLPSPGGNSKFMFIESSDAIQQSHPLLSPFPPTFTLCQHQGLFKWVSSLHQVAKVLEFQLPMNIQDWFLLQLTGWISLLSNGFSRVFSNTTVQKHQFFSTQLSL